MRVNHLILILALLPAGCSKPPPPSAQAETSEKPTLQSWINDLRAGDDSARLTSAIGLGVMGREAKPAVPAMVVALRDTNKYIRAQVAWSLVHIDAKGEEILAPLSQATWDMEPMVRQKVAESLGKIGPPAHTAVPELIRLLKDPYPAVRLSACISLGQIGPGADAAQPYLLSVAESDVDDQVQQAATEALKWIAAK
jgi:HEAT repeat protein